MMRVNPKTKSDMTVVRIVTAFREYGGGSKMDIKELSIRINPYLKCQILIAPFDSETPRSFDERFDFEIIRIKSPHIRYNIPIISGFINNIFFYFKVFQELKRLSDIDLIQTHEITPIAYSCILGEITTNPSYRNGTRHSRSLF